MHRKYVHCSLGIHVEVITSLLSIQAVSELSALQRQNLVLSEDVNHDDKLSSALTQIEELQKELTLEKEQRAAKEATLAEEINQLQETAIVQENKSMTLLLLSLYSTLYCVHGHVL